MVHLSTRVLPRVGYNIGKIGNTTVNAHPPVPPSPLFSVPPCHLTGAAARCSGPFSSTVLPNYIHTACHS
jgi:hypothetical protein